MLREQSADLTATTGAPAPGRDERITAIGLIVLAVSLFSCLDATAKYLVVSSGLPVGQIVWIRFIAQFLSMAFIVPALGIMNLRALFATNAFFLQISRSVFLALTTMFNFLALQFLQLDQTTTIMFLAPLTVALVAGPLLGEWVGLRRMVAILIGFSGILIVVRPGFSSLPATGAVFSFLSMIVLSVFILLTRKLSGRDPTLVTLFYSMLAGVICGAPYALAYGVWPSDPFTWCLLLAVGLFGGVGHYLFILAYARAPTSYLSPFLYLQIITMVALGYLVFGRIPDVWTITGSCVIVLSGLYLYHRERVSGELNR